ncbi:MAG: isochorismatase family protein [Alphaproteobacteria bacterium]|nr:isochorismatase family protein [Alphaproteobacteria bacterium]
MHFNTKTAALLLIDLQVGFCSPDGHTGRRLDVSGFKPVLNSAKRLAIAARAAGMPVIYTTMAFAPDYSNGGLTTSELRPNLKEENALRADQPDREIMPALDPQPEDIIVEKQRYSAMIKSPLPAILEEWKIEGVVVGGVTTSMCVESTVRDLAMMDYRVFVVPETCGDLKADFHDRAMQMFALAFGRVVPEADMISAIKAGSEEFPHQAR